MPQYDLSKELAQLCAQLGDLGLHVVPDIRDGCLPATERESTLAYHVARELLLNVLRHARTDRAELTVYGTDRSELVVTVRDRGRGFDPGLLSDPHPEIQSGLFDLRERLETRGGGLSIVSILGKGTVATALFQREHQPALQPASLPAPPHAETVLAPRPEGRITVMVVDDHPWVREGIMSLLADHHDLSIVAEAATGEEAIAVARRLKPDLVILDLHLPGIGGIDVTKQILADNPGTQVVGLSAHSDRAMVDSLKMAGAAGFLPKDQLADDLYRTLKSYASIKSSTLSTN